MGNFAQISNKDNGVGIPDRDINKIGGKFFRSENAIKFHPDGSGLGVYLAKIVVNSSGGKFWFESVENIGSTFYFTLPLLGSKEKKGTKSLI